MKESKPNAEARILEAATAVFVEKGKDGARMQEIADRAGINKALLHYYFKSKDKLFEGVFNNIANQIFPVIGQVFAEEHSLLERINLFVDAYLGVLLKNPLFPAFVFNELNRNTARIEEMLKEKGVDMTAVFKFITDAMDRGEIRAMNPRHMLINIISMCVFPFLASSVARTILFDGDKPAYNAFLQERKQEVKFFITQALKPE